MAKKHHFKSNVVFSNPAVKVDRDKGVIRGIQIAMHGENKNGSYFNDEFLEDLASAGNAQKQGVKCRFGHPNMCAASLGTFLGRHSNFTVKNRKVFSDLTLDPITKKTQVEGKGVSMWEYVLDMAQRNPDMFGNSIVIASELFDEKIGSQVFDSHILRSFIASDLVDDPAATDGLFDTSDLGTTVTTFLDENPQIFGAVQKDPSIIEDFFHRYVNYLNHYKSKTDMSLLNKLKKKFSSSFDIEETTATGEIVKVTTDDETPQVGDKVSNEDGSPVSDGELTLKDGTIWVIENGEITEIKEPETDGETDATVQEIANSVNRLTQKIDTLQKENEAAIVLVADQVNEFGSKLKKLSKAVKSQDYDIPPAEQVNRKRKGELSLYDKVKQKLNDKNEN